jgi:TPR repeat protein
MSNEQNDEVCAEAERLINLAYSSTDDSRQGGLIRQAYEMLFPLVENGVPQALYLHACYTLTLECSNDRTHERRHMELIQMAAHAGHAKAQFALGQLYDNGDELGFDTEKSAYWFRLAAEQGYAYAQWVHGINLLSGSGVPRDEALGLDFIRRSAEGRFEGALQFMADAYAEGSNGFPKDEDLATQWRERLRAPDVISY